VPIVLTTQTWLPINPPKANQERQCGFVDRVTEATISFAYFVPPRNGHISMSGHQKSFENSIFFGETNEPKVDP